MYTSKSIARALLRALERGEDPKILASKIKSFFTGTSAEPFLVSILFHLKKGVGVQKNEEICRIQSAVTLSEEELKKIQEIFGTDKTNLELDSEILGGFRIRFRDFLYDNTLEARLKALTSSIV